MQKTFFLFLFAALFGGYVQAQSCFPDGVQFFTQAEVDNFPSIAPGCTAIAGSLQIYGSDITNLDSLSAITSIAGNFWVNNDTMLSNLTGLNNLTSVGGDLFISNNQSLQSLAGLNSLQSIGGNFYIDGNRQLLNLDGLENLATIGGAFVLYDDDRLTNLNGMLNLNSVGDGMTVWTLDSLQDLDGLNQLENIHGKLQIDQCPLLTSIAGFQNLQTISGAFICIYDSSLVSLSGLTNLTHVGDSINISINPVLISVTGFNNILTTRGLRMLANNKLTSITGFQKLTTIGQDFNLLNNESLSDISGFKSLENIYGTLWISGNNLKSLNGLDSLTRIFGDLLINEYMGLSSLHGLEHLVDVGGSLELNTNHALTNLAGFEQLATVGEDFILLGHDSLNTLAGLEKLVAVGGTLLIGGQNNGLKDLHGLENLNIVGKNLLIQGNITLTGLAGLDSLQTVGGRIVVDYNPQLSNCVVEGICHQLDIAPDSVFIQNNNTGCQSAEDVKIQCALPEGQCLINGIIFYNQAEIDQFSIDYPGCREILGSVDINGADINNLEGLDTLLRIGGNLNIFYAGLTDLSDLKNLDSIGGQFQLYSLKDLNNLEALEHVNHIGSGLVLYDLPALTSLKGLENSNYGPDFNILIEHTSLANFENIGTFSSINYCYIDFNNILTNLSGLESMTQIGTLFIRNNFFLNNLTGLENAKIQTSLDIRQNFSLASLTGLQSVDTVDYLYINQNPSLINLAGLDHLQQAAWIDIYDNNVLTSLHGLESLTTVTGPLTISGNLKLANLEGLSNLNKVVDSLSFVGNSALTSMAGLQQLKGTGGLWIEGNQALTTLSGLDGLTSIEQNSGSNSADLTVVNNAVLSDIQALQQLNTVGRIRILENPMLPACAVLPVCTQLAANSDWVSIENNAPGCNTPNEVEIACGGTWVTVSALLDFDGDCQPFGAPIAGEVVHFSSGSQSMLRATDANGQTQFIHLGAEPFSIQLPQILLDNWEICTLQKVFQSQTGQDSIHYYLLLKPTNHCPELTTKLDLPSFFRGCQTTSEIKTTVRNTGGSIAEGVKMAVVLPPVVELLASVPPIDAQSGDTLYFDLGDLSPLDRASALLTVRTKCDTFLLGQTLCVETFARLDNECPATQPAFSEIKLSAHCIGDTTVRFTLQNIGDAPTLGWHEYTIIRNETIQYNNAFQLAAQQSLSFDFPAEGATWRMEATKLDDGTKTAVALEHCGGLTPGLITAFWLDHGPLEYDFDCRQVIAAFDPNLKSAVPTGTGFYAINPEQTLHYTIDFQNTGTDTAYRVLLRDQLPVELDPATFLPGVASHPYSWAIQGHRLEVLFSPIALPDSNTNEAASHGYFSFDIDVKPNLPEFIYWYNTAAIYFDNNPPIYTNYVYHSIGKLSVKVVEPQHQAPQWQVLGNPTSNAATFRSLEFIPGEKNFALYDATGRRVRSAQFSDQVFDFQRNILPSGVYFFQITTAKGLAFSGQIVITD